MAHSDLVNKMCLRVNPSQAMDTKRMNKVLPLPLLPKPQHHLLLCSSSVSLEKFRFPKLVIFQTFLFPESNTILQNLLGSKVECCLTRDMYVGLYCPLQKCPCPSPQKSHCALLWSFCLEHSLSTMI